MMRNMRCQMMAAAVIIACCIGSTANAAAIVAGAAGTGSLLKLNYSNFPGTDGEFGVFISTNSPNIAYANSNSGALGKEDFRTFCVQLNEYIYDNQTVRVAALGTVTASTAPHKVLTKSAAWLFREYSQLRAVVSGTSRYKGIVGPGATTNYNTFDAANNAADANLMQQALWSLMGWTNTQIVAAFGSANTSTATNKYMALVAANSGAINALQCITGVSVGGVSIMNLVDANTQVGRQDMLYFNPESPDYLAEVPEPSSLVLFGIGLVTAGWSRRRRRVSQAG